MSTNEGMKKNQLITKLEEISTLYGETVLIKKKMDRFKPEDNYKREAVLPIFPGDYEDDEERKEWETLIDHSDGDAIEQMEEEYDYHYAPREPKEPQIKDFQYSESSEYKDKQSKLGCFSYIAAGISGFFLLSIIIGTAEGAVSTIGTIAIISALVFALLRFKMKREQHAADEVKAEALAVYNRNKEELQAEYKEKLKQYESECISYKLRRQDFLDAYSEWREIYLQHLREEEMIEEKLEDDRRVAVQKILEEEYVPAKSKLDEINDLVTEEYLPVLDTIIELLRSNRADDLKEAINLFEDLVYRERQLKLQREKEEQRRREEAQRRADEERRYQEEKEFREKQERQRQYEEEQRQRDEERRHREDLRAREQEERNRQYEERKRLEEERRRNEREARTAATNRQKRCMYCAYQTGCGLKSTEGAYNCTGFRPR